MTKSRFTNAIARATGEDYGVIARRGFSLVSNECPLNDEDIQALISDWNRIQAEDAFSLADSHVEPLFEESRSIRVPAFAKRKARSRKHRVPTVQGH